MQGRPSDSRQFERDPAPPRPSRRWAWLVLAGVAPAILQAALGFGLMNDGPGQASPKNAFDTALSLALLVLPFYLLGWSLFLFRGSSVPIGWRIFWSFPIAFAMTVADLVLGLVGCVWLAEM